MTDLELFTGILTLVLVAAFLFLFPMLTYTLIALTALYAVFKIICVTIRSVTTPARPWTQVEREVWFQRMAKINKN